MDDWNFGGCCSKLAFSNLKVKLILSNRSDDMIRRTGEGTMPSIVDIFKFE